MPERIAATVYHLCGNYGLRDIPNTTYPVIVSIQLKHAPVDGLNKTLFKTLYRMVTYERELAIDMLDKDVEILLSKRGKVLRFWYNETEYRPSWTE